MVSRKIVVKGREIQMKSKIKMIMKNHINNKSFSEVVKIIYAYRYLSWILTSFVYLLGKPYYIILYKLGVIISLFILTTLITDLYIKYKDNKAILKTFILIETFGITLLLLPTGGLLSPFIWYALNPILVAAYYLPVLFCWIILFFYLICGTVMSYFLFNPNNLSLINIIINYSNYILVFSLIILAVQLLSNLTKKLMIQTQALEHSNNQKQEFLDYIMSLYQLLEAFNNHSSKDKLFETLAKYTTTLTKSELCIFWFPNSKQEANTIYTNKSLSKSEKDEIYSDLLNLICTEREFGVKEICIAKYSYLAVPIQTQCSPSGLIAIQWKENLELNNKEQNIKLLEFLSGLSAVTLERFYLEDMQDNLLVMEEQNRIANEIHDSVSQRLFSITYAIHGILARWSDLSNDNLKDYLIEINETSNCAMQELRNSIYKLSSKKNGEKSLQLTLKKYFESISMLNHINIKYNIDGDDELIPLTYKQGITRIIREACGNAIRHGKCKTIHLMLNLNREKTQLIITDDGVGFHFSEESLKKKKGLGISNMRNLVETFHGDIKIKSHLGAGTEIKITIPLTMNDVIVQ